MTYIDKILLTIVSQKNYELSTKVHNKDANILRSLANSVSSNTFITENQSKLLMKVLRDNHHHFADMSSDIVDALNAPLWSKPFRMIEQIKKLYIDYRDESSPMLSIEFTFSANIRKVLTQANKLIDGLVQDVNGKSYHAELTERNIITLVDALRPLGFDIDEMIVNHYNTIKSWTEQEVRNQFQLTNMSNQNFLKHITADLGITTAIDQNIIHDRSVRYRYLTDTQLPPDGTLTREIATRGSCKIWIDSTKHSFYDVISSLIELKRLPLMLVFDSFETDKIYNTLVEISAVMEQCEISDNVGIYFRMPNTGNGTKFNELIANKQYNQYLGPDTKVVGVQSGKIPKFFLANNWKPMSVISIGGQLRNSKTAVYASCCDLIISYNETPPIVGNTERWL